MISVAMQSSSMRGMCRKDWLSCFSMPRVGYSRSTMRFALPCRIVGNRRLVVAYSLRDGVCRVRATFLTICAVVLTPLSAFPQSIQVRVVDRATREALAGAIVSLVADDGKRIVSALSNEFGIVVLNGPVGSRSHVQVERTGYLSARSTEVSLSGGRASVGIELESRALVLPRV